MNGRLLQILFSVTLFPVPAFMGQHSGHGSHCKSQEYHTHWKTSENVFPLAAMGVEMTDIILLSIWWDVEPSWSQLHSPVKLKFALHLNWGEAMSTHRLQHEAGVCFQQTSLLSASAPCMSPGSWQFPIAPGSLNFCSCLFSKFVLGKEAEGMFQLPDPAVVNGSKNVSW